jgi:hypothetical protein
MCPSPDELTQSEATATPESTSNESSDGAGQGSTATPTEGAATPAHGVANVGETRPVPAPAGWRPPVLVYTLVSIMTIAFVLWVIFSWSGYADKYSQVTEGWHLGSTKMIEITLVREDKEGLACASNVNFEGNRCLFGDNGRDLGASAPDELHTLRPYNTVRNELFVGAGLWNSPGLPAQLPKERFSVVCNYHVLGVAKNMALRWGTKANFDPLKNSVAVGTLTDCVIPQ